MYVVKLHLSSLLIYSSELNNNIGPSVMVSTVVLISENMIVVLLIAIYNLT